MADFTVDPETGELRQDTSCPSKVPHCECGQPAIPLTGKEGHMTALYCIEHGILTHDQIVWADS